VKIALRHNQVVGKRAVVAEDADYGPVGAMRRQVTGAHRATAATAIDFADHAPAGIGARFRNADELVAEDA
jgi:hypothetical protein